MQVVPVDNVELSESRSSTSTYSSIQVTSIDSAVFIESLRKVDSLVNYFSNMEPKQKDIHSQSALDPPVVPTELDSTTLFQAVRDWSQSDFMNIIMNYWREHKLTFSQLLQKPDESGMYVLHYASKLNRFFVMDQLLRRKDELQVSILYMVSYLPTSSS
ncbi:hypothetical protein LOD99_13717 [Oopsacas minuta]|uniref:Uncharacterized protein n=1 Tax=Oopsacas minuta TaxID=111878 RepID=A0AAV7KLH5_9METZ|nr:hypothetical protein LOD99_13717 [Oopsacas minuta]